MSQRTILIMMAPAHGHLNCTFSFGHRLQKEGYKVIYAVPQQMQLKILEQGFETVLCPTQLFAKRNATNINNEAKLENFFEILIDRITNLHLKLLKESSNLMNKAIQNIQPDLLLLDCFLVYNYFLIKGKKPITILMQTMLDTSRREGLPPLNSYLLPDTTSNQFNAQKINWAWKKLMYRKKWKQLIHLGDSSLQILYRLQKGQKATIKSQLDFERVFHPSIKKLPELILAPKSIDLAEFSPTNKIYVGSSLNFSRKELPISGKLKEVMEDLIVSNNEKNWIYCSLGTLNQTHNKHSRKFFEKVIEVFRQKTEWELILSTGELKADTFKYKLRNVHIFEKVPQLQVLKYCRVMITHGGLNSTLEGIKYKVPMLVFPLNNNWDQNGNAARVVHYGLGVMGKINKATTKGILEKLNYLITNDAYKQRLEEINSKISAENGIEQTIQLIHNFMFQNTSKEKRILSAV